MRLPSFDALMIAGCVAVLALLFVAAVYAAKHDEKECADRGMRLDCHTSTGSGMGVGSSGQVIPVVVTTTDCRCVP